MTLLGGPTEAGIGRGRRIRIAQVALPGLAGDRELDRFAVLDEFDVGKRQLIRFEFLAGGLRERGSQFVMIECREADARFGVHETNSFAPPRNSLRYQNCVLFVSQCGVMRAL